MRVQSPDAGSQSSRFSQANFGPAKRVPPNVGRIVKGTDAAEAAQAAADWAATQEANELYSQYYAVVAMPGVQNIPTSYPEQAEERMVENDFAWMAENRERILAEWSRRYEEKAAPKEQ